MGPEAYTIRDILFKENNTNLDINYEYLEWEKESQQNTIFKKLTNITIKATDQNPQNINFWHFSVMF